MARGLTNALQLALSAASGGLQGYGAKQQRLQKEEQMRQALERQKEQDALTTALKKAELAESGWMEEPQFEAQRNAAGLGLGSTLASALQVAGGGSPLTPQGDMSSISRGTLTQKPAGKITFGGSNLVLPETQAMRQERIGKAASYDAQQKAQRAQEAKQAEINRTASLIRQSYRTADGKQLSEEQSRYAAESGKNPMELGLIERPMTAAERARLGIDRERLGLDRERLGLEKQKAGGGPDNTEKIKRLPVRAQTRLEGVESGILMANELRGMIESNPNAVGLKGFLPNVALDRMDPAGVAVRAAIENLSGEIRNQRFGGALTRNEAEFALRNLPDQKQDPQAAMTRIDQLIKFLEVKRQAQYRTYGLEYMPISGEATSSATEPAGARPPLSTFIR